MKTTKNSGWNNPGSSFTPQYDAENNLIIAKGVYIHNGIEMPFSLKRQRPGKSNCAYRGSMVIESPETGYRLTCGPKKQPCKIELNTDKSPTDEIKNMSRFVLRSFIYGILPRLIKRFSGLGSVVQ